MKKIQNWWSSQKSFDYIL